MIQSLESGLEKIDGFETDLVKILYYDIPANYIGQYRSHSYPRLCTILEGEKHLTVDHKRYTYDSSKSLILPAHSKVIMEIDKPTKALVFELSDVLIDHVLKQAQIEIDPHEDTQNNELILNNQQSNLMEDLTALMSVGLDERHRDKFLIDLYAQKLVYGLLKHGPSSHRLLKQKQHPMAQAIEMMSGSLDERINISSIAGELQMSESNFSQQFKKHLGVSPQKFFTRLKLEKALTLLKRNTVTDVAFELGFESPSHFIRLFKENYQTTPKQYQLRGLPAKATAGATAL